MANTLAPGYVLPNPKVPKIVGFFNVVFGAVLLLVGLFYVGLGVAWLMAVGPSPLEPTVRFTPGNVMVGFGNTPKKSYGHPSPAAALHSAATAGVTREALIGAWFWAEAAAGLLLNLGMIVSGFGLIRLSGWARRLALWVASLKVARLAAMTVAALVVAIPAEVDRTVNNMVEASAASGAPASDPAAARRQARQMFPIFTGIATARAVGFALFGAVYPALSLYLLSRRDASAACRTPGNLRANPSRVPPGSGQ